MQAAVAPRLCTAAAGPLGRRQPLTAGRRPWAAAPSRRRAGLALLAAAEGQASRVGPGCCRRRFSPGATFLSPLGGGHPRQRSASLFTLPPPAPTVPHAQKDRHRMVAETESEEEYDAESDIPMSQVKGQGESGRVSCKPSRLPALFLSAG